MPTSDPWPWLDFSIVYEIVKLMKKDHNINKYKTVLSKFLWLLLFTKCRLILKESEIYILDILSLYNKFLSQKINKTGR